MSEQLNKKASKNPQKFVGTFIPNSAGYGFVSVEGYPADFFIPEKHTLNAFYNDFVAIEVLPERRGRRIEARVTRIIERTVKTIAGTLVKTDDYTFVRSDNPKMPIEAVVPKGMGKSAKNGARVFCEILKYPNKNNPMLCRVTDIIGTVTTPLADIVSIAKSFNIPVEFPDDVEDEIRRIDTKVSLSETKNRHDFRNEIVITIDGDDSKDFDDAVSFRKEGDYFILGVHIADVSHYVSENSPLDKEALNRGNSVYLLDVVVPMLPEKLSNGICSLNPRKDRLTLSVIMKLDMHGRMVDFSIEEGVISSRARMTYKNVNKIFKDIKGAQAKKHPSRILMLIMMRDMARLLRERRLKRGAIDFDLPESDIKLDNKGRAVNIAARQRGESEKMIEEFMLLANETVALAYHKKAIPFIYRHHPRPENAKIKDLSVFLSRLGISFMTKRNNKVTPAIIEQLMKDAQGTPNEEVIRILALRSMQQAKYAPDESYHFGLASDYYCHFTSPIRRYSDLVVHRIIKEDLHDKYTNKRKKHYNGILFPIADRCSKMERRAIECEREVDRHKMAEFMQDKIGECYEGYISGVASFGIFVTLPNTVEGLIPIESLKDDRYKYVEVNHEFIGKYKGKSYRLGDRIEVEVNSVDVIDRQIEFRLKDGGKEENNSDQ